MYTPDRELNPPNEDEEEYKEEVCIDCDQECEDMRYEYEDMALHPICPICQQERIVNNLQIQLSSAVKYLNNLKLQINENKK